LIRESPEPDYYCIRGIAYANIAEALGTEGKSLAEATENERKAIASFERPVKDPSAEPEYHHGITAWNWHMLGRSYSYLGELLARTEDFEGAEKAAVRSVRIYTRLTDDFPTMPDFQASRADCHRKLGELYQRWGKLPEAEEEFRRASKIEKSLRGPSGGAAETKEAKPE
jgi:tetratricopeptide (TPR) repeat protein